MRRIHHSVTLGGYVIGFVGSITLTLAAYTVATSEAFTMASAVGLIAVLALVQFIVQLIYFLHLGREHAPKWQLAVFGFMIMVVVILVGGSIWIMNNLQYHQFTPSQQNQYLHSQDGI